MARARPTPATVRDLVTAAKTRLGAASHSPQAREASLLMGHLLTWSEAEVLARDDRIVTEAVARDFEALIARRLSGEPVAYLTGSREFYGRPFFTDDRVLIPRPETEHLVEAVLSTDLPRSPRILDIATGSGCVGITLALELADSRIVLTDRSLAALAVARSNARALASDQDITLLCTDWAAGVDLERIDLVVSNPPYIAFAEAPEISREITGFEPPLALFAESNGLAAYWQIFAGLVQLQAGTPVLCEVGRGQAQAVSDLAFAQGFTFQRTLDDYAGIERVVVVIR